MSIILLFFIELRYLLLFIQISLVNSFLDKGKGNMTGNKIIMARLAFILVIGLTATVGNYQAAAQQDTDIPIGNVPLEELTPDQIGDRADELLRKIRLQTEKVKGYVNRMKTASEEDRLVLDFQMLSMQQ